MKRFSLLSMAAALLLGGLNNSMAWHVYGTVACYPGSGGNNTPLANIRFLIVNTAGTYSNYIFSDEQGRLYLDLADGPDSYVLSVDPLSLPSSVSSTAPIIPASGQYAFTLTDTEKWFDNAHFLYLCGGACWLTGGGVKFESLVGQRLAEGGPADTLGGNVYPGCSPTAGDGGQWNHVAHTRKLHFQGRAVQVVRCGNVVDIPPGSTSPQTPFNFIEFVGTGTLKGIKGNKVDYGQVYFFARCEDRNEPGSNGAKAGTLVDRYFLQVYTDPANATGSTVLQIGQYNISGAAEPVLITGGNLQIHISSCDNPPQ